MYNNSRAQLVCPVGRERVGIRWYMSMRYYPEGFWLTITHLSPNLMTGTWNCNITGLVMANDHAYLIEL